MSRFGSHDFASLRECHTSALTDSDINISGHTIWKLNCQLISEVATMKCRLSTVRFWRGWTEYYIIIRNTVTNCRLDRIRWLRLQLTAIRNTPSSNIIKQSSVEVSVHSKSKGRPSPAKFDGPTTSPGLHLLEIWNAFSIVFGRLHTN